MAIGKKQSKNSRSGVVAKNVYIFNDKEVVPTVFYNENGKIVGMCYKADNQPVYDLNNNLVNWVNRKLKTN